MSVDACCLVQDLIDWWESTPELESIVDSECIYRGDYSGDKPLYISIDENKTNESCTTSATRIRHDLIFKVYHCPAWGMEAQLEKCMKCELAAFETGCGSCPKYVSTTHSDQFSGKRLTTITFRFFSTETC